MVSAAQTPTVFLNAAAAATVGTPQCVEALSACGYSPGDFGSYKELDARLSPLRAEARAEKAAGVAAPVDPDKSPSAHERWLGECQSGHIAENSRHQPDRHDTDTAHCPLYDIDEAPCMPHQGNAFSPKNQHGAVLVQDRQTRRDAREDPGAGVPLGLEREKGATRKVIDASLDWGMNDEQACSQVPKDKRYAAIAELNAKDPKIAEAKAAGDDQLKEAIRKKHEANKKTAGDCIEAFVDAQWKEMARKTKGKKLAAEEQAKKDAAAADAKVEQLEAAKKNGKKVDAELAQARNEQAAAKKELVEATKRADRVRDLDPETATDACRGQARATPGRRAAATQEAGNSTDAGSV